MYENKKILILGAAKSGIAVAKLLADKNNKITKKEVKTFNGDKSSIDKNGYDHFMIKEIKKLNTKKYRDISDEFLIEGEHLVIEAYKKGYLKELILEENTDINIDIPKIYVTVNVLKYIKALKEMYIDINCFLYIIISSNK